MPNRSPRHCRQATAHDNEVIRTLDFFCGDVFHAEVFFEFVEQLREFTATAVHEFFSTEHGGHTLEVKLVHFVLEERTVHDFVREIGVVERNDIERLYHIGAVGAGERYVGGEMNRTAECLNAANEGLIGQVFALAVCVEDGQQERSELVSAGDAAENDAGVCSVLEQLHFEAAGSFMLFDNEVARRRSKI